MLLIRICILAFCLCAALFSCPTLGLQRGTEPYFDTCSFPAQLLARHREISTTRGLHENFVVTFLHIRSPLHKALVEKLMFVQVGSICTSNFSSGTALQQDFVIRKMG